MKLKYSHWLDEDKDVWIYVALVIRDGRKFTMSYMWDCRHFKAKTLSEKKDLVRRTRALLQRAMAWEQGQLEHTKN